MISGLGSTALDERLCDLEGSDPKLSLLSLLSLTFLCISWCGESELELADSLFGAGRGKLTARSDSVFATLRRVVLLLDRGDEAKTMALTVDVVDTPENLLSASASSPPTSLVQPMMLANLSVDAEGEYFSAAFSRSRKLVPRRMPALVLLELFGCAVSVVRLLVCIA